MADPNAPGSNPPGQPYKFRGVPPYLDALAAEKGPEYREAAALARNLSALKTLSPFVSTAAEHARRRTPEGVKSAARSLDHGEKYIRVLDIALEAARRMVGEARGYVDQVSREIEPNMATHKGAAEGEPTPDPTANPRDPATTAPDGSGPVPADASGKPIDLSVDPKTNPNPEVSDIGRLKEGKETFEQTQAENQANAELDKGKDNGGQSRQQPAAGTGGPAGSTEAGLFGGKAPKGNDKGKGSR